MTVVVSTFQICEVQYQSYKMRQYIAAFEFVKISKVQSVRNATGCVQEVAAFFNMSAKRNYVLKNVLGHKLRRYRETRWGERHESILMFLEDFPKIVEALQIASGWNNNATASKANCLLHTILNCEFIITIFSLSDIMNATVVLSKYLQDEDIDICRTQEKITHAIEVLKDKRQKSEEFFCIIFKNAKKSWKHWMSLFAFHG